MKILLKILKEPHKHKKGVFISLIPSIIFTVNLILVLSIGSYSGQFLVYILGFSISVYYSYKTRYQYTRYRKLLIKKGVIFILLRNDELTFYSKIQKDLIKTNTNQINFKEIEEYYRKKDERVLNINGKFIMVTETIYQYNNRNSIIEEALK
jgi:hypothetical protein